MKKYLKDRLTAFLIGVGFVVFLNVYLTQLCATALYGQDVLYLDVLLAAFGTILLIGDYSQWKKKKRQEEEQKELLAYTDKELLECKEKLENLSDYITKWTHEIKLPLAALRLMNGRNQDTSLKKKCRTALYAWKIYFIPCLWEASCKDLKTMYVWSGFLWKKQ